MYLPLGVRAYYTWPKCLILGAGLSYSDPLYGLVAQKKSTRGLLFVRLNEMPAPESVKRGKIHLAITLALIAAALIGGPYGLQHYELMGKLKANAWLVLAIAYAGILLKVGIAYLITRDFRYDKSAYELCVLVLGGALTCLALQIGSPQDLFPGLEEISFLQGASVLGLNVVGQHIVLLFLLFVGALILTVFAAMGVADTENGKASAPWTLVLSALSYALLATYALALIAKR